METLPAAEATASLVSNPMLTITASGFGGAILTGLATFVWSGKRDHEKWLNELKFKCYAARTQEAEAFFATATSKPLDSDHRHQLRSIIDRSLGTDINIVGSAKVMHMQSNMLAAMFDASRSETQAEFRTQLQVFSTAADSMVEAMRIDLKVRTKKKDIRERTEARQARSRASESAQS